MQLRRTYFCLLPVFSLGLFAFPDIVRAQISSDGTLSTTVSTDDAVNFLIENGDRSGSNLFHSFSEFSIPDLGSAYFNNATDITNIFSRVTGGNISEIQGLIRANGTANLFLINPAGIIFGENASLDVGGSFFATTAESVVFGDGIEFSATEPQEAPLLTINITPGVQFGNNPGTIQVQGNGHNLELDFDTFSPIVDNRPVGLQVNSGQTLGLIGGDILVEGGNLTANQGTIELGSVAQSGTVNLTPTTDGFTINYADIENFGNLSFTQASSVDISGEGSGNLHFQAGNISVLEESAIISNILGADNGGEVLIRASESIEIIGTDSEEFPTGFFNQTELGTTGNGGDISINARNVQITNGGGISGFTLGDGDAGNITLNVEDTLTIDGEGTFTTSRIESRVSIAFFSNENFILGSGNGGDISINARNVQITNGGEISGSTFADGDAGNITLNVEDTLTIDGGADFFPSSILSNSATNAAAGTIEVTADSLMVSDRAQISVSNTGTGDAGNLNINAENIFLDTQGSLQGEVVARSQGNVNLTSQFLLLRNNSNITTNAGEQADGGNITIETVNLVAFEDSDITANAFEGRGGNIIITAQGLFLSLDSDITASSQLGLDGTITINNPNSESKLGISQLPVDTTDASQQIAEGCQWAAAENASSFTVRGRGGIPSNTVHSFIDEQMWLSMEDLPEITTSTSVQGEREETTVSKPIIEANAWIINERGNVEFVAIVPNKNQDLEQVASSCSGEVDSQVSNQ